MVKRSKFLFAALLPAFAVCAQAQVTTSAMSGQVVDNENQPVVGATVTAVHVPSGTRYGAVTNMDGRYTIQGMRTGGPYKVTVTYVGYNKKEYDGIQLSLGNTFALNASIEPSSQALGEVVVVGQGKQSAGAAHNFSNLTIENTPTIDRNVYDIVKNMPLVSQYGSNGLSIAGTNNRYNSFQIDGTVSNDVFGLSGTGTNGGQTGSNPIPLDAIQEIQVVVSPFDVRQGGFTGGGINAITKQGTNKLQASAYTYYNNENFYGRYDASRDYLKSKLTDQSTATYGGTLGGAFIKDKLFYFVSAEGKKNTYPSTWYPGYSDKTLSAETAQQIANKYAEYTGYKDGFSQRDINQKEFNLLARIDWNINDNNKFSFRYQHANSSKDSYSASSKSYSFLSNGYTYNNKTNSFVAELNSHISNTLYNEARVSAAYIRDKRDFPFAGPLVKIGNSVPTADGQSTVSVNIGTEQYSGINTLDQDVYTIEDNLSWYLGKHSLTFGTHNEFFRSVNAFYKSAYGSWSYATLEDFLNDNADSFEYSYSDPSLTGGDTKFAPVMKTGQFGFYAQDKWNVLNNLELTYGIRFDIPVFFNKPTENKAFNEYAAKQGFAARVGTTPSSKVMVSPRVGFRWYADDAHRTLLRGGVGMFTGRVPFVWVSNAYTLNGVEQKSVTMRAKDYGAEAISLSKFGKNPMEAVSNAQATPSDIAVTDKSFKFPQVLRANLALEQMLPGDVKLTLEGIYSKNLNNVYFENLNIEKQGTVYAIEGVPASAAPYYGGKAKTGDYNSIIYLKNTNKGYSYVLAAALQKHFDFGLDLNGSYTYTMSKSVNDGASSQAASNWGKNFSVDTNSPELGYARFFTPNRVTISASYTSPKYLNGLMSTTIGVVYNGFNGARYSLTMYNAKAAQDFNGDTYNTNSLLYIPTKDELSKMNFASTKSMSAEDQKAAFEKWIEGDSYAKKHRGQYAERFSNSAPWQNQVDLHLAQNIFYLKERGSKLEVTFDILNFANLLNKKWGAVYDSYSWNYSPLTVTGVKPSGDHRVAEYTYYDKNKPEKVNNSSRWHMQVGVRLTF